MNSGIYLIQNVVSKLSYIGQSTNVQRRMAWHLARLRRPDGSSAKTNARLHASFSLHGEKAFQFVVLEYCDRDRLTDREDYWLNEFRSVHGFPVANFDGPADNPWAGGRHTEEAKTKIATALKGRTLSASHRASVASARRGKKPSQETRLRMRAAHLGKPGTLNAEQIRRLKERGCPLSDPLALERFRQKVCKRVEDVQTGKTWDSVTECAEELGVSVPAITNHVNGKSKTCAGKVLRYI